MMRSRLLLLPIVVATVSAVSAAQALSSQPVQHFQVRLDQPVYAGLPIWVYADLPDKRLKAPYPYSENLSSFAQNRVELTCDGHSIKPQLHVSNEPQFCPGLGCSKSIGGWPPPVFPNSPSNGLPVHLEFSLEGAEACSIRWTILPTDGSFGNEIAAQSDWLTFKVSPATRKQIDEWLNSEIPNVPADPAQVVGHYLPSLLAAVPDVRVLRAVLEQMYSENERVQLVARASLGYFPRNDVAPEVMNIVRRHGINQTMAFHLIWSADLLQQSKDELAHIAVRQIQTSSGAQAAAALLALGFILNDSRYPKPVPQLIEWANEQVLRIAPPIIEQNDTPALQQLAVYLGTIHNDESREWLWKTIEDSPKNAEQALIALTWIGDRRDLKRLGQFLVSEETASTRCGLSTLPYALIRAYGSQAEPYLIAALTKSSNWCVRTASAEELVMRGRIEAFRYMLDVVEHNPVTDWERQQPYFQEPNFEKRELIRWLRERFPNDVRWQPSDAVLMNFLKSRIAP